jgi:hypothetical protein
MVKIQIFYEKVRIFPQTTTKVTMSLKTFNLDNIPPKLLKTVNIPTTMKIPLMK